MKRRLSVFYFLTIATWSLSLRLRWLLNVFFPINNIVVITIMREISVIFRHHRRRLFYQTNKTAQINEWSCVTGTFLCTQGIIVKHALILEPLFFKMSAEIIIFLVHIQTEVWR